MWYKDIINGYIVAIGVGKNKQQISESEYNKLLDIINNRPIPKDGYDYKLHADSLRWELVEIKEEPKDKSENEDREKLYKTFTKEQLKIVKNSKFLSKIFDLG